MALEKNKVKRTSIKDLEVIIDELVVRVGVLEERVRKTPTRPRSINNIETFNGEVAPEQKEDTKMKMNLQDKLVSLRNATMILPPNLIEDGRHTAENCGAICGFKVTDEMLDAVYED